MRLSKNRAAFKSFLKKRKKWSADCWGENCPLAVFLQTTKPGSEAIVGSTEYSIFGVNYPLPPWAKGFVNRFDIARCGCSSYIPNPVSYL